MKKTRHTTRTGTTPGGTSIAPRRAVGRWSRLATASAVVVAGAGCSSPTDPTASPGAAEARPTISARSAAPASRSEPGDGSEPVVRAEGRFEPIGYDGTGTAQVVELDDGRLQVRLNEFAVEQGPALHVYLSAARAGSPESSYDDDIVDLGELRGFEGDQTFAIPDGTRTTSFRSVVIWCAEFSVGFVVAPLAAV